MDDCIYFTPEEVLVAMAAGLLPTVGLFSAAVCPFRVCWPALPAVSTVGMHGLKLIIFGVLQQLVAQHTCTVEL